MVGDWPARHCVGDIDDMITGTGLRNRPSFPDIQSHAKTPPRTILHPAPAILLGGGWLLRFRLLSPPWIEEDQRERASVGYSNLVRRRSPGALPGPMPTGYLEEPEEGSVSWRAIGSYRAYKMARGD